MRQFAPLVLFCALTIAGTARAQDPANSYPSKPVRVFALGAASASDFLARYVAQRLGERWGQPMVIDNQAGASGTIATNIVAKAPPDGYSLVMGNLGPFVSAVSLYKNLPYDPLKDFEPLSMVGTSIVVLVTHPSVPVGNVAELIAYAKQKGSLSYSSAGNGTLGHLVGELLKDATGIPLLHVPYKTPAPAMIAIVSGEVQVSFLSPVSALGQIKAGKVRAMAVSSSTRFTGTPEIPSASEAGIPGMKAKLWFGFFTTAKTPRPIVMKLNREIGDILRRPEARAAILEQGFEAAPSTPEELGEWVRSELALWTPIIQRAGIKLD
ncbi:MAG: Bug family tripartite tricarboxylate transporter substrate binding protein [Burkholderiales bacterium]